MPKATIHYTLTRSATLNAIDTFMFGTKNVDLSSCTPTGCTGKVENVTVDDTVAIMLRLVGLLGKWSLKVEVVLNSDPAQTKHPLLVGLIEDNGRKNISRSYKIKWS